MPFELEMLLKAASVSLKDAQLGKILINLIEQNQGSCES